MSASSRKVNAGLSILLAAVLFICVTIITNYFLGFARIDLTENRLFTLSQGTLNTLRDIDETITLRFFFSRELANEFPQIRLYGERVRELLLEYEARSNGRIDLEIIDPEPFTEEEDQAVELGILAIPTDQGSTLYFGLSGTNAVDGREVIPFFNEQRESFLEYDLTQMVHRLSRTRAPKLGLMGNLSLELGQAGASAIMQGRFEPYLIYEELSQSFEIESLSPDIDRLPDDVDVLMIVHPASFPPKTLYAIDQFVLRGGKVLAFIDPLSEMAQQPPSPMGGMPEGPGLESTLDPLLQAWGVRFLTSEVVADRNRALRVQGGQATGLQLSDYVVWLGLRSEDFDAEDPVTSDIGLVQLASAGALTPIPDATTTITPLLQTTSDSMLFSTDEVAMNFNPDDLLRSFESSGERFIIGARISGEVSTAFPDGPPPGESDTASGDAGSDEVDDGLNDEPLPEHQSQSAGPINVIVIADTDLLDDRFWVNVQEFLGQRLVVPTADNATLVINAVDNLMGSSDLIGLRSRGKDERPLTAIEELRRQANDRFLLQEQELVRQLTETENRLAALQGQGGDAEGDIGLTLTPEQEAEIERFQVQLLETRRRLREVQRSLRTDIDALQNTVQFINIALMPILVACVAMGLALYRRRQRQLSRGQSYAGVQS